MKILEEIREIFNLILEHSEDISRMRFEAKMQNGATFRYSFDRQRWEKEQLRGQLPKRETNQLINAVLDVVGIGAAISVLVVLTVFGSVRANTAGILFYSISGALLILYFIFSALYNFLSPAHPAREFFFRFRGILLYLTLSSFYLPLYLLILPNNPGVLLMGLLLATTVAALFFQGLNTVTGKRIAAGAGALIAWGSLVSVPYLTGPMQLLEGVLLVSAAVFFSFWIAAANRHGSDATKEPAAMNLFLIFGALAHFWINLQWLLG
jgi:predicted membrane channel-forming protein YqfA (hemolysin III family)